LSEAVADPDVSAKLKNMAVNPGGANAAQFRAIIASDIVKFGKVVKAAHLHFE
jgi:tripartite-type tricarboxylate transporter receptor subunit TctC